MNNASFPSDNHIAIAIFLPISKAQSFPSGERVACVHEIFHSRNSRESPALLMERLNNNVDSI